MPTDVFEHPDGTGWVWVHTDPDGHHDAYTNTRFNTEADAEADARLALRDQFDDTDT